MSVHEFGNSVEEVQRKLSEILPLVDAGAERAKELHEEMEGELKDWELRYQEVEDSINEVGQTASELIAELTRAEDTTSTGLAEFTTGLDFVEQRANEAVTSLNEVGQRRQGEIEEIGTRLETAATSLEGQFNTMAESSTAMKELVSTLREKTEEGFTELSNGVDGFTTQWEAADSTSQQSLDRLKSTISETHNPEVKQRFNGLNDSTVETVSNVVNLVSDHESGIADFFSAFDTDAENLVDEFKSKAEEMFGNLKDYTENECGQTIEKALENLAKEIVEAFAAEMVASIATTQLGVSTTAALSPIIPELAIAKKITGVMNSIL